MRKTKVFARSHEDGMAIYVSQNGATSFVMTHRTNNDLFFYLCDDGKTLHDIKSFRPSRNRAQQRLGHSLEHVARLTEYVLEETAA